VDSRLFLNTSVPEPREQHQRHDCIRKKIKEEIEPDVFSQNWIGEAKIKATEKEANQQLIDDLNQDQNQSKSQRIYDNVAVLSARVPGA
jgi:hypothetical protein